MLSEFLYEYNNPKDFESFDGKHLAEVKSVNRTVGASIVLWTQVTLYKVSSSKM